MKRVIFIVGLAVMLLFSSCIIIDADGIDKYSGFNNSLRGTWETLYPETVKLEIEYSKITITGLVQYGKPLYGFTRNFPLDGYSEESKNDYNLKDGNIKMKVANEWVSIPYVYQKSGIKEILILKGTTRANDLTLYKK